jgi:hypothetical protein
LVLGHQKINNPFKKFPRMKIFQVSSHIFACQKVSANAKYNLFPSWITTNLACQESTACGAFVYCLKKTIHESPFKPFSLSLLILVISRARKFLASIVS